MKTLPKFDETEITVADGIISIKQMQSYNTRTIQIPTALWNTFCDNVNAEIFSDENRPIPSPFIVVDQEAA